MAKKDFVKALAPILSAHKTILAGLPKALKHYSKLHCFERDGYLIIESNNLVQAMQTTTQIKAETGLNFVVPVTAFVKFIALFSESPEVKAKNESYVAFCSAAKEMLLSVDTKFDFAQVNFWNAQDWHKAFPNCHSLSFEDVAKLVSLAELADDDKVNRNFANVHITGVWAFVYNTRRLCYSVLSWKDDCFIPSLTFQIMGMLKPLIQSEIKVAKESKTLHVLMLGDQPSYFITSMPEELYHPLVANIYPPESSLRGILFLEDKGKMAKDLSLFETLYTAATGSKTVEFGLRIIDDQVFIESLNEKFPYCEATDSLKVTKSVAPFVAFFPLDYFKEINSETLLHFYAGNWDGNLKGELFNWAADGQTVRRCIYKSPTLNGFVEMRRIKNL